MKKNSSEDTGDDGKASRDYSAARDFIRAIIEEDMRSNKHNGRVATRFPPEPNGYLHIGHAKSICLNFGIAGQYGGVCHLRYDDTNPAKEDVEYIDSIQEDVRWLGFEWGEHEYYASNYFEKLYTYALQLIEQGKAYVDDLSADEIREYRGTLTGPAGKVPTGTAVWKTTLICSNGCVQGSLRMDRVFSVQKSTCHLPT